MNKELPELTSAYELFFSAPLYTFFKIPTDPIKLLRLTVDKIDAFCIECDRESIFESDEVQSPKYFKSPNQTFSGVVYKCNRNDKHIYIFSTMNVNGTIGKIGQYPSVADLQLPQIAKYRTLLKEERYKEMARAIGLSAHGIGIGSFIYLRRVFEGLINDALEKAVLDNLISLDSFDQLRMDDKILSLKAYLPPFLVENRTIYAILSKGVHSLTEEECLNYFKTVRVGIELILDQRIEQENQSRKIQEAKVALSDIHKKLS